MRDLAEVIDQIIAVIGDKDPDFVSALKSRKSSYLYSAPELYSLRWNETAETLEEFIGDNVELFNDWQREIINIWMDEEVF